MGISKLLLKAVLHQGPRYLPALFLFIRRWWILLLIIAILSIIFFGWLAFVLLIWVWNTLPHILGYLVEHFAPALQPLLEQIPTTQPEGVTQHAI